jgi:hypothetical protein
MPDLTPAEFAAAEALAGPGHADWAADDARAVLAAARPHLLAEFYEALADSTEKNGALTPAGLRACALLAKQSRPVDGAPQT